MNNKKICKFLLLIIAVLLLIGTQSFAVTLSKVTGVTSSVSSTTATVRWNKLTNATGYEIYLRTLGSIYNCVGKTTKTSATLNGLVAGETYYVKVRAYNIANGTTTYGAFSNEIMFRTTTSNIAQVTNLYATNITSDAVKLNWNSVAGATGYEVYVNIPGIGYVYVRDVNTTNAEVSGFSAGQTHYAKVRAFKTVGGKKTYGAFSNEVKFVTTTANSNSGSNTGSSSNSTSVGTVTNLRATDIGTTTVDLAWNKVTGATGYEIYLKEAGRTYENIGDITHTSVRILYLKDGITYYVKVRAYKVVNGVVTYGSYSNELKFTTNITGSSTTLGKVTNLQATSITEDQVKLTWNRVSNATGYEIYLRTSGSAYENIGSVNDANVRITNLQPGTTYYVKIRAYRTANGTTIYGDYSDELMFTSGGTSTTVTVGTVTNLRTTNVADTTAGLAWNSASNATGYEVYVDIPGSGYRKVGTTSNTNITVTSLTAGTTYYAKVRAYRTVNGTTTYGNYSDEIRFVTTNTTTVTVGTVTNLRTTNIADTTAGLAWNSASNATGYEVYVDISGSGYRKVGTTSNTNITVTSLTAGTTYYAKVRAYRTVNGTTTYGNYSDEIRFVTTNTTTVTVGTVTNLRTTNVADTTAGLAWNSVLGVTGYEIYVDIPGTGYVKVGTTSGTSTTVTGLTAGTTYYAKVRAYRTVNGTTTYGNYSNEIRFTTTSLSISEEQIGKVMNVKIDNTTTNSVKLSWDKVENATSYYVYVKEPGSSTFRKLGSTFRTYVSVSGLRAGKTYEFKIVAAATINGVEVEGEFSDPISATAQNTTSAQIGTITNLQSSNLTANSVTLSWNSASNATSYDVYAKTPGSSTFVNLGRISKTSVKVNGLESGKTYEFKIVPVGTIDGNQVYGEYSNPITVTAR